MRFVRENGLSLFCAALFVASVVGQSLTGQHDYNDEQLQHEGEPISYGRYLVSSHFGAALLENWQSEYLQFFVFILATIWLVQRGSNESKPEKNVGLESDERQKVGAHADGRSPAWARAGGWRTHLLSNSLLLVMLVIFLGSWLGQSLTAWREYNDEQRDHDEPPIAWTGYLVRPDFWEKTFQNWQSEFLAIGTMAVFTIYLRQRGSPESKPVGAPHDETGSSG